MEKLYNVKEESSTPPRRVRSANPYATKTPLAKGLSTVEAVVTLLSERASKKSLELILSIDPDIPSFVRGDPIRLRQVITNLLGNAIKFTDHGEVVVSISLIAAPPATSLYK